MKVWFNCSHTDVMDEWIYLTDRTDLHYLSRYDRKSPIRGSDGRVNVLPVDQV